ncbi:MAG TPA: FKBP-type peptidyl-prolyl cis-trans isomerase [Opitutaceae bacterium]|nr:FKBP-type peptidyl-prolyl cis-trans isomerase [Opitutaceae bacterium]
MKRTAAVFVFVAATAVSAGWIGCSRAARDDAGPEKKIGVDPARAAREAMFGAEALDPAVQWRASGLGYRILVPGDGAAPSVGARVRMNYVGRLKDGTVFDRSKQPVEMALSGMLAGMSTGLQLLHAGGKAVLFVPPELGYGTHQVAGIPPNSGLIFEVELVAVNP